MSEEIISHIKRRINEIASPIANLDIHTTDETVRMLTVGLQEIMADVSKNISVPGIDELFAICQKLQGILVSLASARLQTSPDSKFKKALQQEATKNETKNDRLSLLQEKIEKDPRYKQVMEALQNSDLLEAMRTLEIKILSTISTIDTKFLLQCSSLITRKPSYKRLYSEARDEYLITEVFTKLSPLGGHCGEIAIPLRWRFANDEEVSSEVCVAQLAVAILCDASGYLNYNFSLTNSSYFSGLRTSQWEHYVGEYQCSTIVFDELLQTIAKFITNDGLLINLRKINEGYFRDRRERLEWDAFLRENKEAIQRYNGLAALNNQRPIPDYYSSSNYYELRDKYRPAIQEINRQITVERAQFGLLGKIAFGIELTVYEVRVLQGVNVFTSMSVHSAIDRVRATLDKMLEGQYVSQAEMATIKELSANTNVSVEQLMEQLKRKRLGG